MAITNVVRLGSKGCALIQLADLLVGAVAYDFRLTLKALPAPPSKEKLKMLERIKGATGSTDFTKGFKSTTTRGRKTRIRLFNARLDAKKEIAGHAVYRFARIARSHSEGRKSLLAVPLLNHLSLVITMCRRTCLPALFRGPTPTPRMDACSPRWCGVLAKSGWPSVSTPPLNPDSATNSFDRSGRRVVDGFVRHRFRRRTLHV